MVEKLNFRVVEGSDSRLSDKDFLLLKEDYFHSPLNSNELRLKYGLSKREYMETCKQIRDEENILIRPRKSAKHFYRFKDKWYILKTTKNERRYFGSLPIGRFSEDDMMEIVNQLKKMEWDVDECRNYIRSLN